MSAGCVFCEIVAGRERGSFAYEDDRVVALMDIAPVNPGHLMVVPRRHAAGLGDLDEETGAHVFVVAMRLAGAVRESGVRCEGVNLFLADGEVAFQEVFHVHLHVLPRWDGDSFRIDADWSSRPERAELDAVAASIRASYEQRFG
ncbi:MAG: HIT family protein [Actinomycetota bacterium]|nr:HIT family protein [Actinomycetota bacterium]